MSNVFADIAVERQRQDAKFGVKDHHPDRWIVIATEELGEASKADLKGDWQNYRDELVQLAAVAIAAVEALDRGTWARPRCDDDFLPPEVIG